MKYALALSWRRIRLGIWLALPALILGGAYVNPWSVMLLDSGVTIPNSLFVLWLAGKLFSGDDTSPEEAHLRGLPLDTGRLLLARALLGTAVLAWYREGR